MLRRTKREVEKELPSKTEHVVKCAMSAWQKILYQQITGKVSCDPPLTNGKKRLLKCFACTSRLSTVR